PGVLRGTADRGEPGGAALRDERDVRQCFDVIDDGRTAVQAHDRRERRLDAGIAALPLEGLQTRRLLAADVRPGPPIYNDIEVEAAPEDVAAQKAFGLSLLHRFLERPGSLVELPADVEERQVRFDGIGREDDPLEDQVGILL